MPFLPAISPSISHNVDITSAATYTALGFSGGDAISWNLSLGNSSKLQDVTGGVGYAFGDVGVSFNASFRPNPELVGSYDSDGNYLVNGQSESYPKMVFWITLTYGGSVNE